MNKENMTIETLAEMSQQEFLEIKKTMATKDDAKLILSAMETGKKWGSSGGLGLFLIPGACIKLAIPTAEGVT
jgi:hypothetical protein